MRIPPFISRGAAAALLMALCAVGTAGAWIHDQDLNRIDDRIERTQALGLAAAYEDMDTAKRMRIAVFDGPQVRYGIYVGYQHEPGAGDVASLEELDLPHVKKYEYIDYIRTQATFEQIQEIALLPGVARIEAIPMMYPVNHWGSRVVRARDSRGLKKSENYVLFPSAREELGLDGTGIVVGVLDTGVNDEPDNINPDYPGHEGLAGKFLGGGEFYFGDPLLNTGVDASMNPNDHGAAVSSYHATHVAGTIMGRGGLSDIFAGVAPKARLVDCKVLSDAGAGFGSADGVEWCIHNMDNDWGLTGEDAIYAGIDVLNLSLGGLDASDGTDAGSQMINAAADAGLVCCIATGNDSSIDHISSPAAADKSVAVGATLHATTLDRSDDQVTNFSNEGPRADDGDGDHLDEMKPNVSAPGSNIMSADGDFTSEGESYHLLSGTSMATPHAAGVAALVRQANPSLSPMEVRAILQNTAIHDVPSVKGDRPNDPFGVDPNYDPGCGWGLVDVYAAAKEAMNSTSGVQVVQIRPIARPQDGEVDVNWWTQREYDFQGFNVYRAEDVGGSPGAFVQVNGSLIAPAGSPVIEGASNRTLYTYVDDSGLVLGNTYWYRIEWVDDGLAANLEPAAPVVFGEQPRVATIRYAIAHNEVDHDLVVRLGSSFYDADNPFWFTLGPTEAEQDSFYVIEPVNAGTSTIGSIEHYWSVGLSESDLVGGYLPPSYATAWFLDVNEGGYINRFGRILNYSIFVNDFPGSESGTLYESAGPFPYSTIEGERVTLWIPEYSPSSAPEDALQAGTGLRFAGVNPMRGHGTVRYSIGPDAAARGAVPIRLTVHDAAGRLVRTLFAGDREAGSYEAEWSGDDHAGRTVGQGMYFLRLDAGPVKSTAKMTVVR